MRRRGFLLESLGALIATALAGCAPQGEAPPPKQPALPPLKVEPIDELIALAGLRWVILLKPRAIASIAWLIPSIGKIVPDDLASWDRKDARWGDAPLRIYASEGGTLYPDVTWPELGAPESGGVRAYGGVRDDRFFVVPIGILGEVVMEARPPLGFDVIDPISGEIVAHHQLGAGEQVVLGGAEAFVLAGTLD